MSRVWVRFTAETVVELPERLSPFWPLNLPQLALRNAVEQAWNTPDEEPELFRVTEVKTWEIER